MAYTSGTAANYKDLLAILATFAAANGWTVLDQTAERLYLKGEGTAGTDEIYVGIQTYEDSANGRYNWELFGSWAYRAGRAYSAMPRTTGGGVFSYLWNQPIPYWMVATPRRIMGFAKIGTTYTCFHLGLIDPPATDAQYPYPLLIGGCGRVAAQNYSATAGNGAFWGGVGATGSGKLFVPGGDWGYINSYFSANVNAPTFTPKTLMTGKKSSIITALDGSYVMFSIFMVDDSRPSIYGSVDGLFQVSGYNNSAENIITVSGKNYMVFPDVYRSAYGDYCCMRLD